MRLKDPMPGDMTPRTWVAIEEKCIEGDNDCSGDVKKIATCIIFINASHLVNRKNSGNVDQ